MRVCMLKFKHNIICIYACFCHNINVGFFTLDNDQGHHCKDSSTEMSPSFVWNSPTKRRMRKSHTAELNAIKKRLYTSQTEKKKLQTKLISLKKILKDLCSKRLISESDSDNLEHLDEGMRQIVKREIRRRKRLPVSRTYSCHIRKYALTLHFYSPKAYNYVRSKFYKSLPHPKTISKWYCTISGEPGISIEALKSITSRVQGCSYRLVGSLCFDEMSIRQHIDYCGDKFVGYVDCGSNIECDTTKVAREALVFCVVCINQPWKIPIAYYLINGISTEQKTNLTLQCLSALESTGLSVVSLTCDGLSSNLSMLKSLGCNFNIDNSQHFQTFFKHPTVDRKVYFFLDPSHMIKLIRNSLGSAKEIMDSHGNKIKWIYLEYLHKLQEEEGLHLANKLGKKHILYRDNKMKVKLATQLLSTSVACALKLCKDELKLPNFQGSSATIEFLLIFNDLFDILNSRNMRQYGLKKPLNNNNFMEVEAQLAVSYNYIKSLVLCKTNQKIVNSKLKTGFLGFLININSTLDLYKDLVLQHKYLAYLPMYKISQDHIELIFGCIRSQGGYNNNPTVKQFKSALKKIIVHVEIKDDRTGNCVPLDNISILNIPSTNKSLVQSIDSLRVINASTNPEYSWLRVFEEPSDGDHDFYLDYPFLITEYKNEVISYMAGYILKCLSKRLHCSICLKTLYNDDSTKQNCNLISIKNKGALTYPSCDLIRICKKTEQKILLYIKAYKTLNTLSIEKCTLEIVSHFLNTDIFIELKNHISDHDFDSNHIYHLLKLIVQVYLKIRLNHYVKSNNVAISKRHKFNKLILFKGE